MRRVSRNLIEPPASLVLDEGPGKKETTKAIAFYETLLATSPAPEGRKKKKKPNFEFKAYKDSAVKTALQSLFYGKCAYCESRYASVHPVDIEHWRPKKEVLIGDDGTEKRHGYYWLAADWENLLPSCIDCNRAREHTDADGKRRVLGKGNWFPVLDEARRNSSPTSPQMEEPLLINPCVDDPQKYFLFDEEGYITAKARLPETDLRRVDASIRFYALNRSELVAERRAHLLLIRQRMLAIEDLSECLDRCTDKALTTILEDLISREMKLLHDFQQPSQPFSSMARQFIAAFVERSKPSKRR